MSGEYFGKDTKYKAELLLSKLIDCANGECTQPHDLKEAVWGNQYDLVVKTKGLRPLQLLIESKFDQKDIREVLYRLEDTVGILKFDASFQRKKQGEKWWNFTITLWSQDRDENTKKIKQWKKKPTNNAKSKDEIQQVSYSLKQSPWSNLRPELIRAFQTIVEKKTEDFTGRDYVFNAINNFIKEQPCGYFTIKAKPGVGKSAILAEYVRRTGCIAYFNVRSEGINRAEKFLESVCTQLIERYNLNYPFLPANATQDGGFLSQILEQVAGKINGESVVITVDALDEVDLTSQSPGANVLYLPRYLPTGIYVILTQRSDVTLPFNVQAPQDVFDLMAKNYEEETSRDIQTYVYRATKRKRVQQWVQLRKLADEEFVTQLTNKSEYNFMYLYYVLGDIEAGKYENLSIEKLPIGLEGYYEDHWQGMGMTKKPLPKPKLKIIYVLVEVGHPVSPHLISEVAKENRLTVQEVLDEWKQFLLEQNIEEQICYSVYHASFSDFLHRKDIVQAAEVMINDINTLIVDNLWEGLYGDE